MCRTYKYFAKKYANSICNVTVMRETFKFTMIYSLVCIYVRVYVKLWYDNQI